MTGFIKEDSPFWLIYTITRTMICLSDLASKNNLEKSWTSAVAEQALSRPKVDESVPHTQHGNSTIYYQRSVIDSGLVGSTDLLFIASTGRGIARAEDAQGTPISPSILVFGDKVDC